MSIIRGVFYYHPHHIVFFSSFMFLLYLRLDMIYHSSYACQSLLYHTFKLVFVSLNIFLFSPLRNHMGVVPLDPHMIRLDFFFF